MNKAQAKLLQQELDEMRYQRDIFRTDMHKAEQQRIKQESAYNKLLEAVRAVDLFLDYTHAGEGEQVEAYNHVRCLIVEALAAAHPDAGEE